LFVVTRLLTEGEIAFVRPIYTSYCDLLVTGNTEARQVHSLPFLFCGIGMHIKYIVARTKINLPMRTAEYY